MPTAVQLAGASFVNPLFKPLPVIAGLDAWSYFGGSLAASQNVIAAGGSYTNVNAGPTWSANYGHMLSGTGGTYLQTAFNGNSGVQTCLFVARFVSGPAGGAAAQVLGGSNLQCLLTTGGANVNLVGGSVGNINLATITTSFKFYAGQAGGGNAAFIYDETDGTSSNGGTAGSMNPNASLYTIGGITGSNIQQCDVAFLAHYNAFLSKAQIDQVYAHVKDVMATRGIMV